MRIRSGLPCTECGSSDAVTTYDNSLENKDNSWFCFSCEAHGFLTNNNNTNSEDFMFTDDLPIKALKDRGLSLDTCTHFNVRTEFNENTGEPSSYYFPFYKDGIQVAHKERVLPKEFRWHGSSSDVELFGQSLIGEDGRMIIVCEGLEDTMAGYQMLAELGKNYKIVGLPNGVSSIRKHIEFLGNFDTVFICFDTDQVGIESARKSAELFKPGHAKVMNLGKYHDVNDLLHEGTAQEFYGFINTAKSLTPVGIVDMAESWDSLFADDDLVSVPYPWNGLNKKLRGLRRRELVTLTSGSGMGKSAIVRELEHHLLTTTNDKIGILALEESVGRTAWGIMSIEANRPLHIREDRKDVSEQDIKNYFNATVGNGRVYTLDHFGSTDIDLLLNKIRYLISGLGVGWVFLDHLSIVVSAQDGGDERKNIDRIMTELRSLVEQTGIGLILVSHLRRGSGDKGHEQGAEVSLSQLRGSQSIAQLSDCVIALERDQQCDDPIKSNTTIVRVLKSRYTGEVGKACELFYNRETGRLSETIEQQEEEFQY